MYTYDLQAPQYIGKKYIDTKLDLSIYNKKKEHIKTLPENKTEVIPEEIPEVTPEEIPKVTPEVTPKVTEVIQDTKKLKNKNIKLKLKKLS